MINNFTILALALLFFTVQPIYTNTDAMECFKSKAINTCVAEFADCLNDSPCSQELKIYHKCTFGNSQDEGSHVFNGYCFRRWEEKAQHTKTFIKCFRQSCQLDYNSEIGVKQLFQCAQWVMLDSKFQCQQACQNEMSKLGTNLYKQPLAELYGSAFEDKEAQYVVDLIRKSCIQEGEGKKMIYEEEKLLEQRENKKSRGIWSKKEVQSDVEKVQL